MPLIQLMDAIMAYYIDETPTHHAVGTLHSAVLIRVVCRRLHVYTTLIKPELLYVSAKADLRVKRDSDRSCSRSVYFQHDPCS